MKSTLGFTMVYVPVEQWLFRDGEVVAGVDYNVYFVAPNSSALFKRQSDQASEYLGVLTTDVATLSALRNGSISRRCETAFATEAARLDRRQLEGVATFAELHAAVGECGAEAGSPLARLHRLVVCQARLAQEAHDLERPPSVRFRDPQGAEQELPGTFAGAEVRSRAPGLHIPESYYRSVGPSVTAGR